MRNGLTDILTAYLAGWKTMFDCAEWLSGVAWEELGRDLQMRNVLGELELLATEVAEGIREELEFSNAASDVVANLTESRYLVQQAPNDVRVADSSNDGVDRTPELISWPEASRLWNISPRPAPA